MTERFIIIGPPCAGKSSFVKETASPGSLIYDYDTLHQALSGLPSHNHSIIIRPFVLAARDEIFRQLEAHTKQSAYVITSSRKSAEINQLSQRLQAKVIYIDVDQVEAHRRAFLDNRPAEWHQYIDNWFRDSDIDSNQYKSAENQIKQIEAILKKNGIRA